MTKQNLKGVIYARYSSDNQREESIEGQIRECKEYAERNGITIVSSYIDRALSAKTDNRPEFQHMIKDSAKQLFDVVIVWKLDRFARNRYDSAHYKSILRKNGVKVTSAKETIAEDSTGILLESLLEGYAEFYSAELAEKVNRGMTENALKCKYNGGGLLLGYTTDKDQYYQLDPLTAPIVLQAFTDYANGATIKQIVEALDNKGLYVRDHKPMTINIVTRMLKNRRYLGEYRYRDIVITDGIPAIVPQDLFDRVQVRMSKNKTAPARFKADVQYLLTTKLFCGKCGAYMVGESGTSRTGKSHYYYKCVTAKTKKTCCKKSVQKDWIENIVVDETKKMLLNNSVINLLTDMIFDFQTKENTNLPLLKQQLAETEKGIQNILNAIQAGIFNASTKQRLDELEAVKSNLEVSILQEEIKRPTLTKEQIHSWLLKYRDIDTTKQEHRQRLVDGFVNSIYLFDDKVVITFNSENTTKTVSLADIHGSDFGASGASAA